MLNIDSKLAEYINGDTRTFKARVNNITDGIVSIKRTSQSVTDSYITIGGAVAACIEVSMIDTAEAISNTELKVEIGANIDGQDYWVSLGLFTPEDVKHDDDLISFTGYDRMQSKLSSAYFSDLTYPTDGKSVLAEIAKKTGVSIITSNLESGVSIPKRAVVSNSGYDSKGNAQTTTTYENPFDGYTYVEALGYIAMLYGTFATCDGEGQVVFRAYSKANYTVNKSRYYDDLVTSNDAFYVEQISCTVNEDTLYSGTGNATIQLENFLMTQARLDAIYAKYKDLQYIPASLSFVGDVRPELGDIITINAKNGKTYSLPIMHEVIDFDGGLITEVASYGRTEQESTAKSPTATKIDRAYTELMLVKELVGTKASFDDLTATDANIKNLSAAQATFEEATAKNFTAVNGQIENIVATNINTDNLTAAVAQLGYAKVTDLDAVKGDFKELDAEVADINTLIYGSATGDVIQTNFANAVIAALGDAQITSAMIKDLSASKITGLDINTTKLTVHSNDGLSTWTDNTIQISDGSIVRVQIGKDASNDYSINIWDADGNLMFSQGGITDAAIKSAIIRNDMVSDTANISAYKLNITSLFEAINGSTNTIKSTQIYLDDEKQTLDAAFKTISTTVDDLSETQTSQGTQITAIQGQISSKIWQQDIESAVTPLEKQATELSTQYSELNQSLTGFKATVSETYATQKSVNTSIENLQSQIDGAIESYSGQDVPTLKNAPASGWQTNSEKDTHIGDLYIVNSNGGDYAGFYYRFEKTSAGAYQWTLLKDNEITKALQDAADAKSKADSVGTDLATNYSTTTAVNSAIEQSASNIKSEVNATAKTYANAAEQNAKNDTAQKLKSYSTTTEMNSAIEQSATSIRTTVSSTYATKTELSTTESKAETASSNASSALSTANTASTTANSALTAANKSVATIVVEYYKSTSASQVTGGTWSSTQPTWTEGCYIWSRTKTTTSSGTISYSAAACITGNTGARGEKGDTGAQGIQGLQGEKGDQGIPGADGKSTYFHIKYSDDGGKTFTANSGETVGAYIGTYVDDTKTDSTSVNKYTWALLKGAQGEKGDKGIAGTNGADGKTSYLHIAYANSADGKTGFDVGDGTNKLYIGQYTDFTQSDSTDYTKYTWTKIKGDAGATGATGKGIKSIVPQYYLSTSNTAQSGGSWSSTQPTWVANRYYWTRSYITWTDNTTTTTTPVLANDITNAAQANDAATSATTLATTVSSKVDSLQTDTEALTKAIKEYVKSSDFETYKKQVTSQLSQTPEAITARFNSIESTVKTLDNETKTALNELATYIKADTSGLTLGKSGDPITLNLNNGQITFYQGTKALAYFSDNQLYVSHLAVTDTVDLCGLRITTSGNYITVS